MDNKLISPFTRKLLAILFSAPAAEKPEAWKTLTEADPIFLAEMHRHSFFPLLYSELNRHSRQEGLDRALLRMLQNDYYCSVQAATCQEHQIRKVIQALKEAGVEFILLKGMDLRLRVYGNAAARPMGDLDLLISKAQLPQTKDALARLNYGISPFCNPRAQFRERFDQELLFESADHNLLVDVHWEIREIARFYRLPYRALQDRAVSWDYDGVPVKVLAPEHLLIHLCLHALGDLSTGQFCDDRQIIDIAMILNRLPVNWQSLLHEAAQFRCQAPVFFLLQEMGQLLPHLIPRPVLADLSRYSPNLLERLTLISGLKHLVRSFLIFREHSFKESLNFFAAELWPDRRYLQSAGLSRLAYCLQFLKRLFSLEQSF